MKRMLKWATIPLVCVFLTSCTFFEDFFDFKQACTAGQYLVTYVEIATEVVQVTCATEGQLDVMKQDSTIRIINVGPVTENA
ncbi:MAG: hypothetical protein OXG15_03085 [Gammaproteobacteria bacterium]|nr:hypothetical protein [Gammaproteobacteria bacterium]